MPNTDSFGQPIPTEMTGSDSPVSLPEVAPSDAAPKRKRGRPKGSKNAARATSPRILSDAPTAPQASPVASSETDPAAALANLSIEEKAKLIAATGSATMGMIASRAGEHWKCSEEEFMAIAIPLAQLLPNLADPRILLALGCVAVFGPRMVTHIDVVQKKRAAESDNLLAKAA